MLCIRDLFAWYGGLEALHGVSLNVADGEIVSLIGSNRAGKTTTLRAISGAVRARAGEMTYNGVDLLSRVPHTIPALGIAHVAEGRQVFGAMSVMDNLLVGAYTMPGTVLRRARLDAVCDLFPRLAERRKQSAETLSGGEQQMLAIGRALMSSPSLLMLDEPSQGLAPRVVDEMYESLARVAATGVTILLVEQNVSMALDFATRGYVLENGSVTVAGSSDEMRNQKNIVASYLGI